jgi:hypothetical protein
MKQCLVIGSTVVDILITLPHLPAKGEDINISAPQYRIGGCAYNVYKTLRSLESPSLLCSPVGSGIYGRMVAENLEGMLPRINEETAIHSHPAACKWLTQSIYAHSSDSPNRRKSRTSS